MRGCPEREQKLDGGRLPRHRHRAAYVSLVLDGGYRECGSMGRWLVEPGQFVTHGSFEGHWNQIAPSGARVLNLPVPAGVTLPPVFMVDQPDVIIAAVRRGESWASLLRPSKLIAPCEEDWYDRLASRLRQGPVGISAWADEAGLAPATVCRGFRSAFGITPAQYRLESQVLRAMPLIAASAEPLASIAAGCGFADQAHLTRSVRAVTGATPGLWRDRSKRFNQR